MVAAWIKRADRRRAFHRVRQPDVQRELRGLAHRAAKNQQAGHRRQTPRAWDLPKALLEHIEIQRTERRPDHEDAEQETEIAQAIGDEGFFGGVRCRRPFEPEADEQIAGDARPVPKR